MPQDDDAPNLAARRHTDRCFFAVEEIVHEPDGTVAGYIVEDILWPMEDVAEVRALDDASTCDPPDGHDDPGQATLRHDPAPGR